MKKEFLLFEKKKTLNFFYSLINSDFLLLEKKTRIKKNRCLKSNLKLLNNKKNSFLLLNFFELSKTLKQFIRVLQFFRNSKNPTLFLDFNNDQFFKILDSFFKKEKLILPVKFENKFSFLTKSSFILFLDELFLEDKNIVKKLVYYNVFIMIQINSLLNTLNDSSYKIFNTFDTLKKLIFLMILLKKLYSKKREKKRKICV